MCKNLVEKGKLDQPLILYNRTEKRAKDLSEKLGGDKTKVTTSISDAIKDADIIFMCLGEDPSVNAIVDAILAEKPQGKLIIDCSTVHPDTTNALEKKVIASGNEFVGMPGLPLRYTITFTSLTRIIVFGAPPMADAGTLVCVTAGQKESVDKVKPYLDGVMGRATIDFSDQPAGNATLLKVIGNT